MSTRQETSTEPTTAIEKPQPAATRGVSTAERADTSWVDRCTRQFDGTSTQRLRNLADDANDAMHDGV